MTANSADSQDTPARATTPTKVANTGAKWWVWYNVQSGDPAQVIQAKNSGDVQNQTGFPPLAGPFKSKTEAENWINKSPEGKKTKGHNIQIPVVSPLVHGVNEIAAVTKATFSTLTDLSMWRSLAWIIGGLILVYAGIRLWLGKPILPKAPPVVPV